MPPYLVKAGQEGLLRHYRELAAATALPVIVYQRDNAVLNPATVVELARTEGIVGLKDGYGDLDLMQRTVSAVRGRCRGLPVLQRAAHRRADPARLPRPRRHPVLVGGVLLRAGDRPRLPPPCAPATRPPCTVSSTASTGRSSNCATRARGTPSRWSRRARLRGLDVGRSAPAARAGLGSSQAARSADRAGTSAARGGHVKASAFVYPWDVNGDPGRPRASRNWAPPQVTLAAAYHSTRALTPRHPRHRVVTAEYAAVLYPPGNPAGRDAPCVPARRAAGRRGCLRRGRRRAHGRGPGGAHVGGARPQLPPGRGASGHLRGQRLRRPVPVGAASPSRTPAPT